MSGEFAPWRAKMSDGFRPPLRSAPAAKRSPVSPNSKSNPVCRTTRLKVRARSGRCARSSAVVRRVAILSGIDRAMLPPLYRASASVCDKLGNGLRDGDADEKGRRLLEHQCRARRARRGRSQRLRSAPVSPARHHTAGRLQANEHVLRRLREEHLEGGHLHSHEQAARRRARSSSSSCRFPGRAISFSSSAR